MKLLTGFYRDTDPARCGEFLECIRRNCANPHIEQVHLLLEDAIAPDRLIHSYPDLASPKLRLAVHGRRLEYRDLFEYANRQLAGQDVIIANADVFFDQTLARLGDYDLSGKLLCLSRWDVQDDGRPHLFDFSASQDAWIFRAPIRAFPRDFHLGVPGCDNRLAWEAANAGLAVSNPSRSIRTFHLHASQVRRYTEAQRLSGPVLNVPAQTLGTPWLWFVVPCRGRLDALRHTMDALRAQARSSCVLVDYDGAQDSGGWARTAHPTVTLVRVHPRTGFHGAEARNLGAAAADDDAILCFLDADVTVTPLFSEELLSRFHPDTFLVPDREGPGLSSLLVCSKADFARAGGFDEAFRDFGEEVADLRAALLRAGLGSVTFPASLVSHRRQGCDGQSEAQRELVKTVHAAYRRAKWALLDETGGNSVSAAVLHEIYAAIFQHQACAPAGEQAEAGAAVAFRETGSAGRRPARTQMTHMVSDPIFALTSLSPSVHAHARQRACLESWRRAGLELRCFNHPDEIASVSNVYDVEFVPVTDTTKYLFGRHYVPVTALFAWAAARDARVLLINSDIELQLSPRELVRLFRLSEGGLCYFVRHNHGEDCARTSREPYGLDAFALHGRDAALFPASFLSLGQPFWDYWLPYTFAANERQLYCVEFPAALHRNHPQGWSWSNWHRCALEFDRMSSMLHGDTSLSACVDMSIRVRQFFENGKVSLPQHPGPIRAWVEEQFHGPERKLFLELGAHRGEDTAWMTAIPNVTLHAFEPDPRNHPPALVNATVHRAAIAERNGRRSFLLSDMGWGREWTYSSSIKQPKNHLHRYPVTFGRKIEVDAVTLDTVYAQQGLDIIDFIWADIQGAEGEMIRGGQHALSHTRYLYTEYSDDELYEGQITLREMMRLLPNYHVVELWSDDVLLQNRRLA